MKTALATLAILALQVLYVTSGVLIMAPSHATTKTIGDVQTRAALVLSKCAKAKQGLQAEDLFSLN